LDELEERMKLPARSRCRPVVAVIPSSGASRETWCSRHEESRDLLFALTLSSRASRGTCCSPFPRHHEESRGVLFVLALSSRAKRGICFSIHYPLSSPQPNVLGL